MSKHLPRPDVNKLVLVAIAALPGFSATQAATIVYEGFDYPLAATLPGQSGGTGWIGAWLGPNLGGATAGSDLPFGITNGLSWTNGPGYVAGIGGAIFDEDDGGTNHSIGHGDARQWFDPSNPLMPFDSVYGTNIWFSCLVRYDVVSTSGGIVVPFEDGFEALSGIGVSLKGGPGGLQVYIREHGAEMSTNAVNYLQAPGGLTNVGLVVGRFRLGPPVANPILQAGSDRLDVWLNQTREPTNDSVLFMTDFSAYRTSPYSQGYLVVRTGGFCQMVVDEIKIGTNFSDVVPDTAASPNPKPAQPLLFLANAGPGGLQLNAGAGTTNHYNEITTQPSFECSWVGSATPDAPAIYAFTVTNPPAYGTTDFTAYAWLIASPNGFISAEISNPNVVRLGLQSGSNGTALATLSYKVNDANDLSMFAGSGFLCGITDAPFAGQWTISLTNDTDFTLTAPNGAKAYGSMQSGDTSSFSSQVQFFLGVNPNGGENIGKFITLGSVYIQITNTNATNTLSSDFTSGASLDTSTWTVLADDPASILMMPSHSVFRATWPNAVGSGVGPNSLMYANALGGAATWTALPSGALLGDGTNVWFVTESYTTNTSGFFRVRIPYSP
jgi:hypothetical protein